MRFLIVSTKHTAIRSESKWIKTNLFILKMKFQAFNNNIRSTWKLINSISGKPKKKLHDISINKNDTLIADDLLLANLLTITSPNLVLS